MDDLISRKSAIEEFEEMVTSVSVYGESAEARYATNARIRFIEKLNNIPSVPAVPLEPLCKWLSTVTEEAPCSDDCEKCEAFTGDGEISVCWEKAIKEWMEEQHESN